VQKRNILAILSNLKKRSYRFFKRKAHNMQNLNKKNVNQRIASILFVLLQSNEATIKPLLQNLMQKYSFSAVNFIYFVK
jgi:hypothetical protein